MAIQASQKLDPQDAYNQQALASTQSILKGITSYGKELKARLPKTDIVIEIGVESSEEGATGIVHRVAVLRLDNSQKGEENAKMKVNVSVHKYEELETKATKRLAVLPSSSSSKIAQDIISINTDQQIIVPHHYDLVPKETNQILKQMNADKRCPHATVVLNLVQQVFPNGIPLPKQGAWAVKCHFIIMTKTPDSIESMASFRGLTQENFFSSTAVNETYVGQSDHQANIERFANLVSVAMGHLKPATIPFNAVGTSLAFNASQANQNRQIEEEDA